VNFTSESWLTFFTVFLSTRRQMQTSATTKITILHPTLPNVAAELTELPLRITEVPHLNQILFVFRFPQILHPNAKKIFRVRPQTLPPTLFSIYYSIIIVSLEITLI